MRILVGAALAFAMAACSQAPQSDDKQQVSDNGCPAAAQASWETFRIEGFVQGDNCADAQAAIAIRSGDSTLWSQSYPVDQVMVLKNAQSAEEMQRRLNEWIAPPGAGRDSTGDLPEWAEGDANPMSGEFPFYLEEGVDRAAYEALRARDAPMFCFVQGMESQACLALENGELTKIGAQSFPG